MFNKYLTYYNGGVQILIFFSLFLVLGLLDSFLSLAITPKLSGGAGYLELANSMDLSNSDHVFALKILQLISQLFLFIIPGFLFGYLSYPNLKKYLGFQVRPKTWHWVLGIALMLASIPFINLLEYFNKMIPLSGAMAEAEETASKMVEAFLKNNQGGWGLNILIFVILPAIGEELFFRAGLQNILISNWFRKKPLIAILITACIFSLIHGQMAGFVPRLYAGIILGLAYYYSKSIWIPICMHALNNGLSIWTFSLHEKGVYDESILQQSPWVYSGFLFGLICLGIIYYFSRYKSQYRIYSMRDEENGLTEVYV